MSKAPEVLSVRNLHAWYGEAHILRDINFSVSQSECVALLGRNGAGRTTALRSIMGMVPKRTGSVLVHGQETIDYKPENIARLGVGYCPEERGIFNSLSCKENLCLPKNIGSSVIPEEEIYTLFPALKQCIDRPGGKLSGGEQQMLAIARILCAGAPFLLLDEISEGLAPVIVQSLDQTIRALKKRQYTILLVEQNFRFVSRLADKMYIMESGVVIDYITQNEFNKRKSAIEALLGV